MQGLAGIAVVAAAVTIAACGDQKKDGPTDTMTAGKIEISVDETYRPVIEQQLKVFDSSYPEAKITANYKAEAECFKDLFENKARLILVTRQLTAEEKAWCEQQKMVTESLELVRDAVAVILPPGATDTMFSVDQVKGILTGTYNRKYTVVFDDQSSSTVRYITDSLLRGQKLGTNVFAAKGNDSVVAYVAKNPDAIGFVGLSYIGNPEGTTGDNEFITNVKIASIYNDKTQRAYKPYQAYIAQRVYPFSRNLYYIKHETYSGLGTGFANFLARERGQLIFAHSHLFPLRMNIVIRDAAISR
ncbi:MAG TPA: substrate-binding domain-containing protein [Flavipsychrobacter sp.]|nr:substrate-binding domain-containing protein [Flavipsychrobacter sp.]